ncbi:hypothetical protein CRYUN_Cryun07bG0032700 [Craigia yunnanensis]
MELPQSRPFGAEGKKPTHDFLSLYSHSSVQQDPSPPSQGGYLKTHDFLQIERLGKASAREEKPVEVATGEKPPPPAPPPSAEHILPGGIGTYSISHTACFNPRVPKAEGAVFTQGSSTGRNDENSNCSSYTGSGFTLWEESAGKKGKTGKENARETPVVRAAGKVGQWATSLLVRASQSSTNNHGNSFSSLSSSQPSSKQKSQSFMEMIKSAKGSSHDDDFEEDEDFVLKKECSTTTHSKGELRVKVDGKSAPDQKANTPRSKHSATEQRRRSKINDRHQFFCRFQMLRDLIPRSDQKRDKASFLLEVIEHIHFLHEKIHQYEGTYQGRSHEPLKLMPWRNNQRPTENYADQSRAINGVCGPAVVFSAKLDEKNITVAPTIPGSAHNPIESDMSTATTFRAIDLRPGTMNKTMPFPVSLQPNFFTSAQSTGPADQLPPRLPSDAENSASQPQSVLCHTGSCTTNGALPNKKLKEQELTIEGGKISISSVYSQGLLNTLTQALQTSGVDLSHASISVQIELGKRSSSSSRPTAPTSTLKDREAPSTNQGTTRSRVGCDEDSDQPLKKLKT